MRAMGRKGGKKGGKKGGTARMKNLTPEQRSEFARRGAEARWKNGKKKRTEN